MLWPQPYDNVDEDFEGDNEEIETFIGLTLQELFVRFGVPDEVYALRGTESWQDDVVFVYEQGDFYIYRDRVWQAGLKSVYDIVIGDDLSTVQLFMGAAQYEFDNCLVYSLHGTAWPLMIRFNFDEAQSVSEIFVYRPDF